MNKPLLEDPRSRLSIEHWPVAGRWGALFAISLLCIVPLELMAFPAALLLGPMVAGIVAGTGNAQLRIPQPLLIVAQAVIGCMMARALPAEVFVELVAEWPIYLLGIGSVVVVAAGLGILLARLRVLPGTTAIWGSAPGAAAAMVIMADAFGADARLVAFMTYLRVVLVALAASVVGRLFSGGGGSVPAHEWFPAVAAVPFAATIAVMVLSLVVARITKLQAGAILLPMVIGILAQNFLGLQIELPPALLAVSFALVGWSIGLRFTPDIMRHAVRALPAVVGSIVALIAVCGAFAFLLVWLAGVDPLTAYLATSPGGADSVAIIAANSDVDVPFVMAMQAGRLLVVLLTGPALARFIATRSWARAL
ncbi:MAG: AbrB family transcriptional regulator [Hyphomicrobiales bacterium]|nr:MAG: AbrB family transcriptional regulator [Hyphomicrobiales bacterium]